MYFDKRSEKVKEFLKRRNKLIVHHRDVDGSCSAAILRRAADFKTMSIKDPYLTDETAEKLIKRKPDFIIFLDLAVDERWDKMELLKKQLRNTEIVVLDHHTIHKDLNQFDILHINPMFDKGGQYVPTSLLIFDLLQGIGFDMTESLWISAIGVVSDYGHKTNPDFMKMVKKKHPDLLDNEDIFKSKIGEASKLIYSAVICKGEFGVKKVIKSLVNSGSLDEFMEDKLLVEWKDEVDKEIDRVMSEFEEKKEVVGDVVSFHIKTDLGIASIIANNITNKYPEKTTMVIKDYGNGWKISTRCPTGKVNLAELIKEASDGIGYGGGHPKASGAFVKDLEEFKKRFLSLINQ